MWQSLDIYPKNLQAQIHFPKQALFLELLIGSFQTLLKKKKAYFHSFPGTDLARSAEQA